MDYRTFNEWSAAGYKIRKGSKATWFPTNTGNVAKFSKEQVVKKPPHWSDYPDDYDDPWDQEARDAAWGIH